MPTIKIEVDNETYDALRESAMRHIRPVDFQAKALVRQGLGLEVPIPAKESSQRRKSADAT